MNDPLRVFKASAPVCLCRPAPCREGGPMCGPQRKALKARRELTARGFVFPEPMSVALSHALSGEGRDEFDRLEWPGE